MRIYILLLLAIATSATSPNLQAQNPAPNVVINGSFESPGMPVGQDTQFLTNGSNFIQAWTAIDDGNDQFPFYTTHNVPHLAYAVVLNQQSGLRTIVRNEPGAFYELGLWVEADDCDPCVTPAPLRITLGGQSVFLPLISGRAYHTVQFYLTAPVNTLEIYNPSSTGAIKQYVIDDVSLRLVSGAVLTARLMPVVTVQGTIGARYQIQSTTNLNAPVWNTLTSLVLSNSPTFFMDTNSYSPGAPLNRIYRAIRVP